MDAEFHGCGIFLSRAVCYSVRPDQSSHLGAYTMSFFALEPVRFVCASRSTLQRFEFPPPLGYSLCKLSFYPSLSMPLVCYARNAREEEELFLRLAPRCPQHQRAGKLLTVRKTGLNKGRKFYACSLPRGA